jgi:hypothetical protein
VVVSEDTILGGKKFYHLTVEMTDQDQGSRIQSTPPSPYVEMSADQEWAPNNIAYQNSPEAMSQSSPTWEKAVRAAKPNVEHLTPNLRACLVCQIQKRKCDYGYPGQTKNDKKSHSKNLPCTREYHATRSRYLQDTDSTHNRLSTDGRERKEW